VPETFPPVDDRVADSLRGAAMRLAAELDLAHLYQAAAYASMVADAIDNSRVKEVNRNIIRTDVDSEFELDEHGRVWLIKNGDCFIIGRKLAVIVEMRRFISNTVSADV
jgi:hypothetical protein